mgnify:CR=1 FL=1
MRTCRHTEKTVPIKNHRLHMNAQSVANCFNQFFNRLKIKERYGKNQQQGMQDKEYLTHMQSVNIQYLLSP